MAKKDASKLRNVALGGHGASGKTRLLDTMLFSAGAVNRAGNVEEGSSLSDFEPEEKERKFSIDTAIFNLDYKGYTLNLIDTPGHLDFSGAAAAVLPAVETVLVTIDAGDGIKLNTRRMYEYARNENLARIFVITHIDAENVNYERLISDIQDAFGNDCVPVFIPVGLGEDCSGVVNLLESADAPDGVVGDFDALSQSLRESIVECDDDLMETYLEGGEISAEQIKKTFKKAVVNGELTPILCSSAEKKVGVKEILDFLPDCSPSPQERKAVEAKTPETEETVEIKPDPDAPFCAKVFKIVVDPHVGRLVFFRVFAGTVSDGDTVEVARSGAAERLGHINVPFGSEQKDCGSAGPGDIACVSKVEDMEFGDILRARGEKWVIPPSAIPSPMMSLAVEPKSRDDEQKISSGLQRLAESDPTFNVERDAQSNELLITGMSNLHLEVMLSRLKNRYGVSAETREPSVPYRETITASAEGKYKHKKQSGGRGQYGEVHLRLEPNERGEGFEFIDEIKGGVIPQQFMPAVEKGIRETLETGVLAGCTVVDLKAAVFFGSYHDVDSSEAAFKIAASRAFREAFLHSKPVLLEPVVKLEVTVPSEYVGDVTANLAGHRGQIGGMDQQGEMQTLSALIPQSELGTYSAELQSMTGGEGTFTLEFSHYEPVPSHIQQQIIERKKKKDLEDE